MTEKKKNPFSYMLITFKDCVSEKKEYVNVSYLVYRWSCIDLDGVELVTEIW